LSGPDFDLVDFPRQFGDRRAFSFGQMQPVLPLLGLDIHCGAMMGEG
jgi:hypothetical protein